MTFSRRDFLFFLIYTGIFLIFFIGYNTVSSPYFETTFDSASIFHTESAVQEIIVPTEKQTIKRVNVAKPKFTISFNPEYVTIDESLLKRLKETIDSPYFKAKVTPLNLVLDTERREPRGQVLGNKLILATAVTDDSESTKVLVHELGHIIDIFYLKKGLIGDPSDRFYQIAWEAYNVKKKNLKIADFVSGYALSNKYEDFAESFAFYVFHNEDFAERAKKNNILKQKYDFFAQYVFDQGEFAGTSFGKKLLPAYLWDTTKIPVNTKKYLYYIR